MQFEYKFIARFAMSPRELEDIVNEFSEVGFQLWDIYPDMVVLQRVTTVSQD